LHLPLCSISQGWDRRRKQLSHNGSQAGQPSDLFSSQAKLGKIDVEKRH
jgi:hypothetical protein